MHSLRTTCRLKGPASDFSELRSNCIAVTSHPTSHLSTPCTDTGVYMQVWCNHTLSVDRIRLPRGVAMPE